MKIVWRKVPVGDKLTWTARYVYQSGIELNITNPNLNVLLWQVCQHVLDDPGKAPA